MRKATNYRRFAFLLTWLLLCIGCGGRSDTAADGQNQEGTLREGNAQAAGNAVQEKDAAYEKEAAYADAAAYAGVGAVQGGVLEVSEVSELEYGKVVWSYTFDEEQGNTPFQTGERTEEGAWQIKEEQERSIFGAQASKFYDYRVQIDFAYGEVEPSEPNTIGLYTRARESLLYGDFFYGLYVENGNSLRLTKCVCSEETALHTVELTDSVWDGEWHTLMVDAFDEYLIVRLDGEVVMNYLEHSGDSILFGKCGFSSQKTDVTIDNYIVTRITDPLGGDEDNKLGGNFDVEW